MESVIKWQTGEPKEEGCYFVTLKDGRVVFNFWKILPNCSYWIHSRNENIIAWCKLSDIEPYKEEKK